MASMYIRWLGGMEGILGFETQHDGALGMAIGLVLLVKGRWWAEMAT